MTIKNILLEINLLIGHGDGKGPGDMGYKRMKKVFTNPFSKWLFGHPDIGVRLAQYLSVKNKLISGDEDITFLERTRNG
jgi:UDP-2,3-diacylglucosamine hydrolase